MLMPQQLENRNRDCMAVKSLNQFLMDKRSQQGKDLKSILRLLLSRNIQKDKPNKNLGILQVNKFQQGMKLAQSFPLGKTNQLCRNLRQVLIGVIQQGRRTQAHKFQLVN
jgi:hypothetical protein